MSMSEIEINSERSRVRAALVNSGLHSVSEAEELLAGSRLSITLGVDAATSPAGQAAFLTAVVTGVKCFGQVTFQGAAELPVLLPLPISAASLAEAAIQLGGVPSTDATEQKMILIGSDLEPSGGWSVQTFWDGWIAGVSPGRQQRQLGRSDCVLAGVAAGALAVGNAFLEFSGDKKAGKVEQSLSLWHPEAEGMGPAQVGPLFREVYLPTRLWLVGLGNLGQAYLWSLALLPYPKAEDVCLVLQDDDHIRKENWGTSVLIQRRIYGMLKTQLAESWLTKRGFEVRRVDRRLDEHLRLAAHEPRIALVGLDNMDARRLLGNPGFKYVIDAGLGATLEAYQKFLVNVFDSTRSPLEHFRGLNEGKDNVVNKLLKLPAYQNFAHEGGNTGCGAAMLAEVPVAVPFVSSLVQSSLNLFNN